MTKILVLQINYFKCLFTYLGKKLLFTEELFLNSIGCRYAKKGKTYFVFKNTKKEW